MDPAVFDELQNTLTSAGPEAALDTLCTRLHAARDYEGLFYARLLTARHRIGADPVPTGPTTDISPDKQEAYEDAIRASCREVGQLYLQQGNIAGAFHHYRIIGELQPVKQAIADHTPGDDEDMDALIRISLYEGVLPTRGFDWVLERFGICSAITTLSGQQLPLSPDDRRHCVGRIVRHLYDELCDRILADIERREGSAPEATRPHPKGTLRKLIAGRDWLFGDDCYHIDLSHLSSTVQFSLDLPPGEEMELARELCAYGVKLSPAFRNQADPPFDEPYRDQDIYLGILMGDNVEAGLAHFRAKADKGLDEVGSGPAEVLVQLLQRLGRTDEALQTARRYLVGADNQWLTYTADLCRKANNFKVLADVAREQGNAVQFVAALLACRK